VPQIVVKYVGDAESAEGTDILSNIETIQFSDGSTINAAAVLDGTWEQNSTTETTETVVDVIEPAPEPVTPAPKPTTSTGSANDKILISIDMSRVKYGTKDADTIALSDSSSEWVDGRSGNDTITGGWYTGDNTLLGGAGNDLLNGGGSSSDYLIGGSGIDHLFGGNGNYPDYFIFGAGDTGIGVTHDVIEDFYMKYDKIDLAGATVAGSAGYDVALTFIEAKPFTAINQVRYETDFDNIQTVVQINLDSNFSTVEAEIGLTGLMNLTAANFILTK
jgi:Ca2+-binding RTX toxin-like protein